LFYIPTMDKSSLLKSPGEATKEEWIHGKQIVRPRPASPHIFLSSRLGTILMSPYQFGFGGPGGWVFADEPEIHLGDPPHKLVPDLAAWKIEHTSKDMKVATFISQIPDWVCEVFSPSTTWVDKVQKLPLYTQYGVSHVWYIDPLEQVLDVMRLEKGHYLLLGTYNQFETIDLEPFGPVRLELLWDKDISNL